MMRHCSNAVMPPRSARQLRRGAPLLAAIVLPVGRRTRRRSAGAVSIDNFTFNPQN